MSNEKFYELILGVPVDPSENPDELTTKAARHLMVNFIPSLFLLLTDAKFRREEEKRKHRREFCAVLREIGQKKAKMELLNVLNERKKFLQEIQVKEEYEEILFRLD